MSRHLVNALDRSVPLDPDTLLARFELQIGVLPQVWETAKQGRAILAHIRSLSAQLAEAQRERDEAVRQLRYVLETNDDTEPREFLAHIDRAAIAEGRGK